MRRAQDYCSTVTLTASRSSACPSEFRTPAWRRDGRGRLPCAHSVSSGDMSIGDVEADPAEARDMRFRPGVARRLLGRAVEHQIAADIARGKAEQRGRRDEDLGVILADVPAVRTSPGQPCSSAVPGRPLAWPLAGLHRGAASAGSRLADERHQLVQPGNIGALADRGGQRPGRLAGQRQRRSRAGTARAAQSRGGSR